MTLLRITIACMITCLLLANSLAFGGDRLTGQPQYTCPPCPHVDRLFSGKSYAHDGQCPVCGMNLVEVSDNGDNSPIRINPGSGNFRFATAQHKKITAFYHRPAHFGPDSRILVVIPGAGRNAWRYRDSWIDAAEKYNVLVLVPYYPEQDYDYAAYHLGGILSSLQFTRYSTAEVKGRINKYRLADEDMLRGQATEPGRWLFRDFDLLFEQAAQATSSRQQHYDLFGHSAGGQILHRMALFYPHSQANRLIAANAGTYTLPDQSLDFPLGLGKTLFDPSQLGSAFSTNLILLIGEHDNDQETRGTMLHTPTLDQQGLGRLARGQYFFESARQRANEIGAPLNWQLKLVKDTGHQQARMAQAAARLLYCGDNCDTSLTH